MAALSNNSVSSPAATREILVGELATDIAHAKDLYDAATEAAAALKAIREGELLANRHPDDLVNDRQTTALHLLRMVERRLTELVEMHELTPASMARLNDLAKA